MCKNREGREVERERKTEGETKREEDVDHFAIDEAIFKMPLTWVLPQTYTA